MTCVAQECPRWASLSATLLRPTPCQSAWLDRPHARAPTSLRKHGRQECPVTTPYRVGCRELYSKSDGLQACIWIGLQMVCLCKQ